MLIVQDPNDSFSSPARRSVRGSPVRDTPLVPDPAKGLQCSVSADSSSTLMLALLVVFVLLLGFLLAQGPEREWERMYAV